MTSLKPSYWTATGETNNPFLNKGLDGARGEAYLLAAKYGAPLVRAAVGSSRNPYVFAGFEIARGDLIELPTDAALPIGTQIDSVKTAANLEKEKFEEKTGTLLFDVTA